VATLKKELQIGCEALGIEVSTEQLEQIQVLLEQLLLWNKKINLTAITDPQEVISKHILDSLSLMPYLHGQEILDVGTGAGFPGLPLAILNPDKQFTLLDSRTKKITFIRHVVARLGIENVTPVAARLQEHSAKNTYSDITARAFADLNDLLNWLPEVYDTHTQILAMKGKLPEQELDTLRSGLLASVWEIKSIEPLQVPGLDAERWLVRLNLKIRSKKT